MCLCPWKGCSIDTGWICHNVVKLLFLIFFVLQERSSEKDAAASEAKRRKDSPQDDSSAASSPQPADSKVALDSYSCVFSTHSPMFPFPLQRRLVKVSSKKDSTSKLQETKKLKQEAVSKVGNNFYQKLSRCSHRYCPLDVYWCACVLCV